MDWPSMNLLWFGLPELSREPSDRPTVSHTVTKVASVFPHSTDHSIKKDGRRSARPWLRLSDFSQGHDTPFESVPTVVTSGPVASGMLFRPLMNVLYGTEPPGMFRVPPFC